MKTNDAAERFLNWVREYRKPKTHKWYQEHLAHFLPHVAGLLIADLRADHLADFISVQTWSQSYRAGCVAAVKRWASWLIERELLASNPFRGVISPGIESHDNVPTSDDREEIIAASHGPTRCILRVLADTGARPKELRDARGGWFHEDKLIIPVQFAKRERPRIILLTKRSARLIAALCDGSDTNAHIFLNHKGQPWTQYGLLQALRRSCRRCGSKEFAPYDFRHGFATNALERGTDSLLVGHLMGHADVTMVARVYAKPRESCLRRVLESLA